MNEEKKLNTERLERETSPPARLLLVDDDPVIRRILSMGLRLEGFDITEACNGQDALDVLNTDPPDIVLVDLMMPVMDGVTFIREVREALGLTTPIVMLTSFDREGSEEDALRAGATALLRKPATIEHILVTLQEHLD